VLPDEFVDLFLDSPRYNRGLDRQDEIELARAVLSRRDFLKKSAGTLTGLLGAPVIVQASALGLGDATPPSDRVTVGIIGSGQRAVFETLQYPSFDNVVIVAVCDAVRSHMQDAKDKLEKQYDLNQPNRPNKGIRMYDDFQELLAQKDAFHGFLRTPDGSFTTFEAPGAGTGAGQGTVANTNNAAGDIVGVYQDASSVFHGYLWNR
jgi:hypothetical protein